MRPRPSLYTKLVAWFLLSLVILVGDYAALFRIQFDVDLESPLRGPIGGRALDVAWRIAEELSDAPRSEWAARLAAYDAEHELEFYLVDPRGASLVSGEARQLPQAALDVIAAPPPPHRQQPVPEIGEPSPSPMPMTEEPASDEPTEGAPARTGRPPPPPPDRLARGAPQFTFETEDPPRYWVGVRVRITIGEARTPPAIVMMASESVTGGGLFWDPFPWVLGGLGFLLLSVVLWFPLARSVVSPVRRMKVAAERIAEGDFDVRLDERRGDELGSLSRSINRMAGRLDGYIQGQKRFLGDIAHELASPIGRLQLSLGILEHKSDAESRPRVARALRDVQNLSNLVNELLSFTRAEIGHKRVELTPVSLNALAATAIDRERRDGVEVRNEVPAELHALVAPDLLVRALSNVLRNAVRYAGAAGPIHVTAREAAAEVVLEVADAGPGVALEDLDNLFKPFFRAEASRSRETGGVGLGLAIVETCVTACQGSVSARNLEPRGFAVAMTLKRA